MPVKQKSSVVFTRAQANTTWDAVTSFIFALSCCASCVQVRDIYAETFVFFTEGEK